MKKSIKIHCKGGYLCLKRGERKKDRKRENIVAGDRKSESEASGSAEAAQKRQGQERQLTGPGY